MVIFRKEAAESEVVSSILITVSTMVHHQDSVGHWIASPHVTVITFRQQGRDAHHLSGLLRFLDPVLPR